MRLSVIMLVALGALALTGAAWAEQAHAVINPMGAGLVVPSGEGASPLLKDEQVTIYATPSLDAQVVGTLSSGGDPKNPYQVHVVTTKGPDANWQPNWFTRMLKRSAPIVTKVVPVSDFTLSDKQKGIMIVTVQGSWLEIAQGWFQWTTSVAAHAQFKAWSELYQEGSFKAFQLSNARANRADLVPLGDVTVMGSQNAVVKSPARFAVIEARPEAIAVRVTGGTCKNSAKDAHEGVQGWVHLFAANGAPQILLQPEQCPEDAPPPARK